MDAYKRLYIVTGKGGVGKTLNALSLTSYLQSQNKKAKLVFFSNSKLDPKAVEYSEVKLLADQANIDYLGLELIESCRQYIALKLKSQTIASWVIKTPFFKSLVNMIPGFNYLIYMGQILDDLSSDPDLIYVLDSPSSGHALTMFEATKNFNKIFSSGVLYNDTQKMLTYLRMPHFLKIIILTLPTSLAINEAMELKENLNNSENFDIDVVCNNTLMSFQSEQLPAPIRHKIENEAKALEQHKETIQQCIPFSLGSNTQELIKDLSPSMTQLV
ncbi:MAG: hypothetical protein CME62_13025 [Halobacteriovoraceae bacterium]|nr:hypothetical protein [Halobacteriovoraceae bacterium]|tara:strand:- start:111 stop:929 length:819 start_codon:yes stop_codon:yes gene_type:complete